MENEIGFPMESKIVDASTIKNVDVRYYRDDGLYYVSWMFENGMSKSICVDNSFFDNISYISAHERLKIECPELTEKEIDKIFETALVYY